MSIKRKDNRGRILRDGEIQKADGRYEFRYNDVNGVRRSLYSWRLTATDPLPEGKRQCEDLRNLEKRILRDVQDGIQTSNKSCLNDRWDIYISNKPELKESTRASYKYMYNKYIRNEIGKLRMSSIKYSTLKEFFNNLVYETGLKPSCARLIYTMIHPVFDISVRDGLIRTNPATGVMGDLIRSNNWVKDKKHSLTAEQQRAFMEYLSGNDIFVHWKPLFTCLLGTGCRIGEMLGLKWEDVDFDTNLISINKTLSYKLQETGRAEFRLTTPKTQCSIRVIPMLKSVKQALLEQKLNNPDGEFIFLNRYGRPFTACDINKAIERIVKHYNEDGNKPELPKFTVHQLRHTFCTRLCERETDLKLIQEIMGHADISTTMNIYNESNIDRKRDSFARLDSTTDFTTGCRSIM